MLRNLIRANKIKSDLVVVFFMCFTALAIYFIAGAMNYGTYAVPLAVIITLVTTWVSYYYSDRIVLSMSKARPATEEEDRVFNNVVEEMCLASGLPKPKLYVIDDTAPNAFATGRDPKHAVVCVTTGLMEKLDRNELQGVVAHEISHIKNFDTRLMTIASVMVGAITLLSDWFLRSLWWGRRSSRYSSSSSRSRGGGGSVQIVFLLLGILFAILGPVIAQLIRLAISRRREFLADADAALLTRYPKGLADALTKISSDTEPLEAANKATAHLYIVNPLLEHGGRINNLFSTHPPIEERIAALKSLYSQYNPHEEK